MKTYRILIVDDEPRVAFFFQKHLEMVGDQYLATAVNSGHEAVTELQKNHYDLMITDLRMPGMDGLELLNHVREISPQTKTILVTAYGGKKVWEEADRLNTFRALSKPVKINDLLTAVRDSLLPTTPPATHSKIGIMALTGETYKNINTDLEELRVNLGARAVVLADTAGQLLTTSGMLEALDVSSTMALLGGAVGASNALATQLNFQKPTHLTFFEGPPYDLYVANVSEHFFISIWLDRKVAGKMGMVWLYTQRTIDKISKLLETSIGEEALVGAGFATSVQSDLDELFGDGVVSPPQAKVLPTAVSLPQKVEQIATKFEEQTNIRVTLTQDSVALQTLPLSASRLILRTLAESLKNIYQHAEATSVQIELHCDEDYLMGRITDDGRGFDLMRPPTLNEMGDLQDLFRQKDGSLVLTASPNNGTSVSFQLQTKK